MRLGSAARRSAFIWLDRARGGQIRRELADIRGQMDGRLATDDVLADLLRHATGTTPAYRPYSGGALTSFPIISKQDIRERPEEFRSATYDSSRLRRVLTSGSTGTPLTVWHDIQKRTRLQADVIYFNEEAGLRVGDRLMWLRAWTAETRKTWMTRVAQNVIPVELVGMDNGVLADVTKSLRRGRIDAILGYGSALHRLARYVVDSGKAGDFGLRLIISGAEVLPPPARKQIQDALGCPVSDRYANEENGVLACMMPGEDHFRVNRASHRIEVLRPDRDEPAPPGTAGRVVVTDLYNRAMPLIRYETGDLAVVGDVVDGTVVTLLGIEGRSADVIHAVTGVPISEAMADMILVEFDDLVRYQLVQEDASSYVLRVVLGRTAYGPDQLSAWLRRMLGSSANIRVDIVDDIPLRPNAKFRPLVNKYHPAGEGSEAGHRGR